MFYFRFKKIIENECDRQRLLQLTLAMYNNLSSMCGKTK